MSEILLHVSAGQGPAECRHVVARLAAAFAKEAAADGLACAPLEPVTGEPPSILLAVSGAGAEDFARARTGTIRWIGASPFRPNHRRRNWFVGVAVVPGVDAAADLREADIAYQTMRASGPGGQHVNTTDSAVRATHVSTGLVAVSREQRSQHANKRVARAKLALMMAERREAAAGAGERAAWERNQALERGGAVRTYEGEGFRVR